MKRAAGSLMPKDKLVTILMVAPALILVAVFILTPFVITLVLSVSDGKGYSVSSFSGLTHYAKLMKDKLFFSKSSTSLMPSGALVNSLLWMVLGVPLTILIGFLVSLFANKRKGEGVFRSAFFLPMVISGTVIGIVWMYVYSPNQSIGLLNAVFNTNISWLGNGKIVNYALIFTWIWAQTGMAVVICSAALKGVPEDIIEAGLIDGANPVQRLWKLILPEIRPQLFMLMTTLLVNVLKVFDIVFVMTGGGPANKSNTMAMLFYNQTFLYSKTHYGAAIVTVLSVFVFIIYGITNLVQARAER